MPQNELAVRRAAQLAGFDDAWTASIKSLRADLREYDKLEKARSRFRREERRWEEAQRRE